MTTAEMTRELSKEHDLETAAEIAAELAEIAAKKSAKKVKTAKKAAAKKTTKPTAAKKAAKKPGLAAKKPSLKLFILKAIATSKSGLTTAQVHAKFPTTTKSDILTRMRREGLVSKRELGKADCPWTATATGRGAAKRGA
jgi:hypothetical protein